MLRDVGIQARKALLRFGLIELIHLCLRGCRRSLTSVSTDRQLIVIQVPTCLRSFKHCSVTACDAAQAMLIHGTANRNN
jgi:hypothetical protein